MGFKQETGVVFRVHTKEYRGKELYSFKFDGGDDDDWFRMGEDRREGKIEEGYKITVKYEEDRNGNFQVKGVKVLEKGEPKRAGGRKGKGSSSRKGSSGGSRGGKSDVDWDEKDRKIQYQSARNAAIETVKLIVEQECVKLPAKTKLQERQDFIDGLIDLYTARYYVDIEGKGAVERAGEELETSTSVADEDVEDEGWDEEETEDEDDDDEWD